MSAASTSLLHLRLQQPSTRLTLAPPPFPLPPSSTQIEYDEQELRGGDSSSVVVGEAFFNTDQVTSLLHQNLEHLFQLQPGRNYSVVVRAVSNGMESSARRVFVATSKWMSCLRVFLTLLPPVHFPLTPVSGHSANHDFT